jgi:hypothetical protein
MNPLDDQLNRLFRAAAKVSSAPITAPAFGLEARALAAWRAGRAGSGSLWDMTLLVRGLILASLVMALSLWPALKTTETTTNPFAEYLQVADSTGSSSDDAP